MPRKPFDVDSPMPFGKYKGSTLEELPSDYMFWCIENLTSKEDIVSAMRREMSYREANDLHRDADGVCLPLYGQDFGGTGRRSAEPAPVHVAQPKPVDEGEGSPW